MVGRTERVFLALAAKRTRPPEPGPLLVELMGEPLRDPTLAYEIGPFSYQVMRGEGSSAYQVSCPLPAEALAALRKAAADVSEGLDPRSIVPLTFGRLVEVLMQLSASRLAASFASARVRDMSELVAYEAIGLSRVLALAKDSRVTEFYVDSDASPVYLDHLDAGRCETTILLSERERGALETHMDTFNGYTLDYGTPSMKNDIEMSGARLRVSLDLDPISVNRFSLDVRRLNVSSLTMPELIALDVLSADAASLLVGWLESGGNVTIIGETGTGKTTLLNALDEMVRPQLRRLYIEDAVETRDLIARGYHQLKLRVDPFDRGEGSSRTKESEIVKALHRSPDIVILSEVQSEEHSRAFFHALSAGAKGIQTFHASTVEQALRRWVNVHGIPPQSLLDLGLLVQMSRPDRLGPRRLVARVCEVITEGGSPKVRELFIRDREARLRAVGYEGWLSPPPGVDPAELRRRVEGAMERVTG